MVPIHNRKLHTIKIRDMIMLVLNRYMPSINNPNTIAIKISVSIINKGYLIHLLNFLLEHISKLPSRNISSIISNIISG